MKAFFCFFITWALTLANALARTVNMTAETDFCQPNFPDNGNPCLLRCKVDLSDTGYKVDQYKFYYYTADPSVNVDLRNVGDYNIDVIYKYENNQVQLETSLRDYNAGRYVCWISLVSISNGSKTEMKHEFDIDSTDVDGILLGSTCSLDRQCWALEAQCHAVCECASDFINYNGQDNTPACLPKSAFRCIKDEQCLAGYVCTNNICSYEGHTLSTGAIVGIVLGCIAFVGLMIGLVFYHRKQVKKFWKNKKVVTVATAEIDN